MTKAAHSQVTTSHNIFYSVTPKSLFFPFCLASKCPGLYTLDSKMPGAQKITRMNYFHSVPSFPCQFSHNAL